MAFVEADSRQFRLRREHVRRDSPECLLQFADISPGQAARVPVVRRAPGRVVRVFKYQDGNGAAFGFHQASWAADRKRRDAQLDLAVLQVLPEYRDGADVDESGWIKAGSRDRGRNVLAPFDAQLSHVDVCAWKHLQAFEQDVRVVEPGVAVELARSAVRTSGEVLAGLPVQPGPRAMVFGRHGPAEHGAPGHVRDGLHPEHIGADHRVPGYVQTQGERVGVVDVEDLIRRASGDRAVGDDVVLVADQYQPLRSACVDVRPEDQDLLQQGVGLQLACLDVGGQGLAQLRRKTLAVGRAPGSREDQFPLARMVDLDQVQQQGRVAAATEEQIGGDINRQIFMAARLGLGKWKVRINGLCRLRA